VTLIGRKKVDRARNEQGVGESFPGPFHMAMQASYFFSPVACDFASALLCPFNAICIDFIY